MWLAGMKWALKEDYKQMPESIYCLWAWNGLQGKFTEVSHLDWERYHQVGKPMPWAGRRINYSENFRVSSLASLKYSFKSGDKHPKTGRVFHRKAEGNEEEQH